MYFNIILLVYFIYYIKKVSCLLKYILQLGILIIYIIGTTRVHSPQASRFQKIIRCTKWKDSPPPLKIVNRGLNHPISSMLYCSFSFSIPHITYTKFI